MAKEKKCIEVERFIDFLGGISRGIKNVIGENAECAIIHYGAVSCGKEIAEKGKYKTIDEFVQDNEGLLMHSAAQVSISGDEATIKFGKCYLNKIEDPVLYAVLYGLLEGALSHTIGGNFKSAGEKCKCASGGSCEFSFSRR